MKRLLAWLGESLLDPLSQLGGVALLACTSLRRLFRRPFELEAFTAEVQRIGYQSTAVVGLLGLFTGMVMVVQTGQAMKRWGTEAYVSEGVALVILRELGPVLAGFLVAGRIGSGIAAELGAIPPARTCLAAGTATRNSRTNAIATARPKPSVTNSRDPVGMKSRQLPMGRDDQRTLSPSSSR